MQEERQRLQEEDVGALGSVALSECCAAADYRAGALGGQRFQCMQGAAGGDNVIHDQDALAVHILDVLLVDDQRLLTGSRDGLILDGFPPLFQTNLIGSSRMQHHIAVIS